LLAKPGTTRLYKTDDAYAAWLDEKSKGFELGRSMGRSKEGHIPVIFVAEDRALEIPLLPADVAAPHIDGDLGEPAWTRAAVASDFRRTATGVPAGQPTEVRVLFDRDTLYLGVRCREANMTALTARARRDDSATLFNDDTFELFLGHRHNYASTFWQVAVNALGTRYDAVTKEPDYDLALNCVTGRGEDEWRVEMAIPFKSLGLEAAPFGKTWHGNFCRTRRTSPRENTSWSPLPEGFHDPRNFGKWVFADR
jgi:hypothetical protein